MSGIINGYCTLNEFLRYITPEGHTLNEDAPDDAIIENLIMQASRRVDNLTGRKFYPFYKTLYFDIPPDNTLWFDEGEPPIFCPGRPPMPNMKHDAGLT